MKRVLYALIAAGCLATTVDAAANKLLSMFGTPIVTNSVTISRCDMDRTERVELATNDWKTAVNKWKDGLQQIGGPSFGSSYFASSDRYLTVTNMVWNNLRYGDLEFVPDDRYALAMRCTKEHVNDYPKVSTETLGVQRLRKYKMTSTIGGEEAVTEWEKYDYPHVKITRTTTLRLVKKTDVVDVTEPIGQGGDE